MKSNIRRIRLVPAFRLRLASLRGLRSGWLRSRPSFRNRYLRFRLQLAAISVSVRERQGDLQPCRPPVHGEAELSPQEGIGI